jgi:hypothetical protein
MVEATQARPDWHAVEELLEHLAATRTKFSTVLSGSNSIESYEPGRRLRLEGDRGSSWVEVESIKECWETFERLGRIRRRDVLEPGRCSAFVMALFQQVAGIREETLGETYLCLPR